MFERDEGTESICDPCRSHCSDRSGTTNHIFSAIFTCSSTSTCSSPVEVAAAQIISRHSMRMRNKVTKPILRSAGVVWWTLSFSCLLLSAVPSSSSAAVPSPSLPASTSSLILVSSHNSTWNVTPTTTITTSPTSTETSVLSTSSTSSNINLDSGKKNSMTVRSGQTDATNRGEASSISSSTATRRTEGGTPVLSIPPSGIDRNQHGVVPPPFLAVGAPSSRPDIPRLDGQIKDNPPRLVEENKEEDMINNMPAEEDGEENIDGGERIVSGDKPRLFPPPPLRDGDKSLSVSSVSSLEDHAFGYIVMLLVACVVLIVFWRKRQRILAYLIEGRRSGSRRRNPSRPAPTAQYRKLNTADDD